MVDSVKGADCGCCAVSFDGIFEQEKKQSASDYLQYVRKDIESIKTQVAKAGLDCGEAVDSMTTLLKNNTTNAAIAKFESIARYKDPTNGLTLPELTRVAIRHSFNFAQTPKVPGLKIEQLKKLAEVANPSGWNIRQSLFNAMLAALRDQKCSYEAVLIHAATAVATKDPLTAFSVLVNPPKSE